MRADAAAMAAEGIKNGAADSNCVVIGECKKKQSKDAVEAAAQ